MLNLAGDWTLSDETGTYRCRMRLPGDGITALHAAGLIPDPYWGRNEYALRWICERDWTITREFTLSETQVDLALSEVDCVVTVRVNDQIVLKAENAFRTYRVPLTGKSRVGRNTISVTFHAVVAAAAARQAAHPFPLPDSKNCPIRQIISEKRPQGRDEPLIRSLSGLRFASPIKVALDRVTDQATNGGVILARNLF